ncbi:hypothetical protein F5Y18DRAFT_425079 [Xylariaceae sp. FL1019]|nr:hypothetical protein F5Y18DRAFT_425079 [Xylariaceae sp. FL1019]
MESINNMAAAAAKAVWGENQQTTQEPVSGKLGDTSRGEPYDAGNIETPNATETPSVTQTSNKTAETYDDKPDTGAAKFAKETGTATESNNTPDNPSTDLKEKRDVPADTSAPQADVRDPEDPQTHPKSAPTDVNNADEDGVNEAQKLDGPGPKPLNEVAREHGGDAGNSDEAVDKTSKKDDVAEATDDNSKSEGTGEQYVKSTGLQADGGDFDATKPGAGREADRLMEVKGIHNPNDDPKPSADPTEDTSSSPDTEKKSLGQKIKDKLHRH